MPSRTLDAGIARLYQLPLDEFTSARNALAKQSGPEGARIRALAKPAVPAWAVNQLHWRDRDTWDALIAAADHARRENRAVLAGRRGDVRAANRIHEEAVETALKSTLSLLVASGHPASDATKQAIATTLRALPSDEPPGRLTHPLQPAGFDALAGLALAAGKSHRPALPDARARPRADTRGHAQGEAEARVRGRSAEAAAARTRQEAESAVKRAEFEEARADREMRRATEVVEKARGAVARAAADLDRAERDAREAARAREAAVERARNSREALARATR